MIARSLFLIALLSLSLAAAARADTFNSKTADFAVAFKGETSAYKVRLADGSLMKVSVVNVNARGRAPYAEGDAVWLSWPADAGILLTS